jgi:hypothetical protein
MDNRHFDGDAIHLEGDYKTLVDLFGSHLGIDHFACRRRALDACARHRKGIEMVAKPLQRHLYSSRLDFDVNPNTAQAVDRKRTILFEIT